jgi:hypothetical protein
VRRLGGLLLPLLLTGCDPMPVIAPNDTNEDVLMDLHGRDFPTPVELEKIKPGLYFGSRHCWKTHDAILVANQRYPDPIILDPKDFCNPDDCDCEIPISKIEKRMTPSFVLKSQQQVCAGTGPFLQPDIRTELCTAYLARATGDRRPHPFSWELPSMLDQ